jgi:hypothetical protein
MELNLSIGKILLLTYIIISSSYCSNLFSNGLKKTIENNRLAQHIILILLIMSLILLFGKPFNLEISYNNTINVFILTLLIYVWFILTTKLDLAWNIGIIILLVIYFLYENKSINDITIDFKDKNVTEETKINIVKTFIDNNNYILLSLFGLTLLGTLFYSSEKQEQYGGSYNLINFWLN